MYYLRRVWRVFPNLWEIRVMPEKTKQTVDYEDAELVTEDILDYFRMHRSGIQRIKIQTNNHVAKEIISKYEAQFKIIKCKVWMDDNKTYLVFSVV